MVELAGPWPIERIGQGDTGIPTGRSSPMTAQTENKRHGLADNLWAQMAIVAVIAIVVIALSAKYLW
jgi:hypothetical protein